MDNTGLTRLMEISWQGSKTGQRDLGRAGAARRPQEEEKVGHRVASWMAAKNRAEEKVGEVMVAQRRGRSRVGVAPPAAATSVERRPNQAPLE
ncbi:hypothetical protein NDU88_001889 [Pleurodeles waltl]|uniref:Uncharacterized protein n=1 Tax=Pleurodeles waltl TaxID=8319 RepID=A0AAV7P5A5_PLEWA|nr:hypothetical protein NDU88_001889 [Pleurodeles waltl]